MNIPVGRLCINSTSLHDLLTQIKSNAEKGIGSWVVTANLDIVRMLSRREHAELRQYISKFSIVTADGVPISKLAKFAGKIEVEKLSGSDLIWDLGQMFSELGLPAVFVGGPVGDAKLAEKRFQEKFPQGNFKSIEIPYMVSPASDYLHTLLENNPGMLVLIGVGSLKTEYWIKALRQKYPSATYVGCGAAISFAAGTLARAPKFIQKTGFEWLFRFIKEPKRLFRRYFVDDIPFILFYLLPVVVVQRLLVSLGRAR